MTKLTFQKFVEVTYVVANDLDGEDYIPTYLDPAATDIRSLDGVPEDVCMQTTARDWASGMGQNSYFLAYQQGQEIVLENYLDGHVIETARIEITNSRIQ